MTIPVLVDTDCDIDDWLAIGYLLGSSNIEIVAITTTGCGAAHLTAGTSMMISYLSAIGAPAIPVIPGTNAPISFSNVYPCSFRAFVDSGFGLNLPSSRVPPQTTGVQDFIANLATIYASRGQNLTVLAIGGGTNLGLMIQKYGVSSIDLFDRIVFMGGALRIGGNVNGFNHDYLNTVAEWNVFIDPVGAQLVIDAASTNLTLVPLDLTNQVRLTKTFVDKLNAQAQSRTAKLLGQALLKKELGVADGDYYFWDPLAAAVLAAGVASTGPQNVTVSVTLDEEDDTSGQTLPVASGGTAIEVATTLKMSVNRFQSHFIATLNKAP